MLRASARCPRISGTRRRYAHRRGVSDIVAVIMMVVIVVVLAAVLFVIIRGYTAGTATTPGLGTAFALGTPQESVGKTGSIAACSASPCNFYNLSVQATSHTLELHDIAVEIIAANGSLVLPPGGVVVVNATNQIVGQSTWAGTWTVGGSLPVTSSFTFVVYTSGVTPTSLSGETLRFIGVSAYSGNIEVHVF